MTTREFINRNFGVNDDKKRWCSSVFKDYNGDIYSYGYHYPLLLKIDGLAFRNVSGYSNTTAKHINWSFDQCDFDVKLTSEDARMLYGCKSDTMRLGVVRAALERERDDLLAQMFAKKRKNTLVFATLNEQFSRVATALDDLRRVYA